MTDTIEAVARSLCCGETCAYSGQCYAMRDFGGKAQKTYATVTKALIEGAGELEQRLLAASAGMRSHYPIGAVELIPTWTMDEAAVTIAALRAENERAKEEGVRAGIEAAAKACDAVESPFDEHAQAPENCAFYQASEACEYAIRALDAAAIAKGV